MTRWYPISQIVTAGAYFALAGLMSRLGNKEKYTHYWIGVCLCLATMFLMISLPGAFVTSQRWGERVARLGMSAGAGSAYAFLGFGLSFLGLHQAHRWALRASLLGTAALWVLFWTGPLIIAGMGPNKFGVNMPIAGPLMPVYGLFCLANGAATIILFVRRYRNSSGRERLQTGYLLVALAILVFAAVGTLLPTLGQNVLALVPSLLMILAPSIITYAIIKHQLWDIRTVIHKTVMWIAASLTVVVPVYFALNVGWPLLEQHAGSAAALGAMLLTAVFWAYFRVVQPWINHKFSRGRYDPARVLDLFNREVVNLRGVGDLSRLVQETVQSTVYATQVHVAVAGADRVLVSLEDGRRCDLAPSVNDWLRETAQTVDITLLEQLPLEQDDVQKQVAQHFRKQGMPVVLPLVDKAQLLGLVGLGEKKDLRAYTREDFQLLERIRPAAVVALANARMYDQVQDLTASLEKRVEQRTRELERANEQLQQMDRQKNKFFANITHELRTPLTMILAPLEDLLLREGKGENAEDLATIHRNALRLLRQINGLLDLAKLDAGELRLKVTEISLNQMMEAAVQSFRPIGRRKRVSVEFVPLDGDDTLIADPSKLDLVVGNLLANATKFTLEGGRIRVAVERDGDWLVIAVRDNGIGIAEDQLERIFDRFAQVESGAVRRFEGAGIGLSLVREMVSLHGGEIEVTSKEGVGSEFRIRLHRTGRGISAALLDRREVDVPTGHARRAEDRDPVGWLPPFEMEGEAWVSAGTGEHEAVRTQGGPRIMVVEDNLDLQAYLTRRLGRKYQLEICGDGKQALQRAIERPPDLVLSDVMMPELSGYDLCRMLKENPLTSSVPVILVTARKGADRTLEGFKAGADDYLTKPFNIHELLARIEVQLRLQQMSRELAERQKGKMLNLVAAGLAHEVRNPINAILNAVRPLMEQELLESHGPAVVEARTELLGAINDSAGRIDQLCADLLGVSRPHLDETADWQLAEAVDSTMRLVRHKRQVEVALELELGHSQPVFGRTPQLNQVLLNLLDNAVRAAGEGSGRVRVQTEEHDGCFRLHVMDSGPGLPVGQEDQVFDPLFSTHARDGSVGLGLHICRRIVEQHHGHIFARNRPQGGAEFVVELPHHVD